MLFISCMLLPNIILCSKVAQIKSTLNWLFELVFILFFKNLYYNNYSISLQLLLTCHFTLVDCELFENKGYLTKMYDDKIQTGATFMEYFLLVITLLALIIILILNS